MKLTTLFKLSILYTKYIEYLNGLWLSLFKSLYIWIYFKIKFILLNIQHHYSSLSVKWSFRNHYNTLSVEGNALQVRKWQKFKCVLVKFCTHNWTESVCVPQSFLQGSFNQRNHLEHLHHVSFRGDTSGRDFSPNLLLQVRMSRQFIERPQQCDRRLMHNNISIKVIVHKNDSVIIPKLHEFLSSAEHRRYFEECW